MTEIVLDPYRDINFVPKKAIIYNKDGKVIFEKDVVFPDYFSDTSVNIVSEKYFKESNDNNSETDIRQLFDRVSDTITKYGSNYFDSEKELQEFNYNLKYFQIHQYFSFNSPVYFNLGISDNFQASACFILSIEDTMESIANIGVIESKIFKKGSGTGSNLSRLRSKRESVGNYTGRASGPVSFLKVHDTFAGVIKSGGSLRRSAKMACLNIDHPDIDEFIDCKKYEEEKLRILKKAGLKNREGYELSDEVYYQNTNLSIRITNEFMKAVLENKNFSTKFITTGEICESFSAREKLYKIAQRAHECGDPGLLFHDNTNDWNTCANDGQIVASNPCIPLYVPILTPTGYQWLSNLKNRVQINGEKECSYVFKTSNCEKVYEVELENGMCLYATGNHKITTERGDVALLDLNIKNDKVKVSYEEIDFKQDLNEYEKGFIAGYLFSKGSIVKYGGINFTLDKNEFYLESDIINILKNHITKVDSFKSHNQKPNTCKVLMINDYVSVNEILNIFKAKTKDAFDLFDHNLSYQCGFIESFITFNGYVLNNDYTKAIRISQSGDHGKNILKQVQLSLACFGVYSNLKILSNRHQTIWNLLITDVWTFQKEFSLHLPKKQSIIDQIIANNKNYPPKLIQLKTYQKIKSIKLHSEEAVYDINVPDGNHFIANGIVVHNCGEFVFLDNSSCNLASINLIKFFSFENGKYVFDFETFQKVIETVLTAQDILVDASKYPTEEITKNSKIYRPLGLGYTNLGALLTYLGLPYDSNRGREVAAYLTSLMTGYAYIISNKIANKLGSFERFKANKSSFYNVISKHIKANKILCDNTISDIARDLFKNKSEQIWGEIQNLVEKDQGFRNAQVTLLAPTGTISHIMGAYTTGIEPEFSHIKYKRLSNSESSIITFTNPIIEIALKNLGYSDSDIDKVKEYVKNNNTVRDCPYVDLNHQKIFDTSCGYKGIIDYHGHLKMMAAVQPLLSAAISKTINMPNSCTVEDVFKAYLEAWKLGLKGITIYRDGSKLDQPLNVGTEDEEDEDLLDDLEDIDLTNRDKLVKAMHSLLAEKKLPEERPAINHKFSINNLKGYLNCGLYDDGTLGEVFITISKEGSTLSGLLDCLATLTSISLQRGVPLKDIVDKMMYQKFEPAGFTSNKNIKVAFSVVDYVYRYLGLKFLSHEEKKELGLIDYKEESEVVKSSNTITDREEKLLKESNLKRMISNDFAGPTCSKCGAIMVRKGACNTCMNCGNNDGACG